jgi:3-oxoadipate enol-lactonase/4-carboxymuconolactone decarboxylase
MPFTTRDGVRLYWRFDGAADKPVLFLLNSIGTDMALWDRALPSLLPDFRILRMDTRGHGASDAPPGDYTLDLLAGDVLAVMDTAGVATAALCGISLGGMIAMTVALRAPARLSALVLACTSAQMDRAAWQTRLDTVRDKGVAAIAEAAIGRFFSEHFRKHHVDVVESVRTNLIAVEPTGYAGCCAAIRDMALLDTLPKIAMPVLVISARGDISTPREGHGDKIVAAIPRARSVVLSDAAHLANVEQPGAFADAVRGFLKDVREGSAVKAAAQTLYQEGLKTRRAVLGDAWVEKSLANRTAFNSDFQEMITRYAWNEIWGRPGLDHRTRRLLVIAITAALGRWEEFRLHVRAGLEQGGFTRDELRETLMQSAIYAGVPAANTAFAEAMSVMEEMDRAPQ